MRKSIDRYMCRSMNGIAADSSERRAACVFHRFTAGDDSNQKTELPFDEEKINQTKP